MPSATTASSKLLHNHDHPNHPTSLPMQVGNEYSLLKEGIARTPAPVTDKVCPKCTNGADNTTLQLHSPATLKVDRALVPLDPDCPAKPDGDGDGGGGGDGKDRFLPTSIVRINISGKIYITLRKTLMFFPDTLLGSEELEDYWLPKEGHYYLNRHRGVFNSILFFYQSRGIFRPPNNVEGDIVREELEFFKIDLVEIMGVPGEDDEEEIPQKLTFREKLHTFLTDPTFSKAALYWSFADMIAIVVSIIMLVAESVPAANVYFKDREKSIGIYFFLYSMEILVNGFFTVDFLLKFVSWPKPWMFFRNPLNFLDFMAIVPFYMELIALMTSSGSAGGKFVVLRICRTSRVVRIFRFARHNKELLVVMRVVSSASKEFAMLGMLIMVFVLLFGTLLYYCEMGHGSHFESIPLGCWWAIVTVTTVGYGDLAPKSTIGRLIGSIAVVLGIVILALPMTVIVSKFNESYGDVKRKTEQDQLKRRERERETLIGECNIFVVVRNGEMWSCFGRCLLNSDFNSGGNCTLSLTLRVRELNDMLVSELKKCDNKFVLRMLVSFIFKVKSKTNTAASEMSMSQEELFLSSNSEFLCLSLNLLTITVIGRARITIPSTTAILPIRRPRRWRSVSRAANSRLIGSIAVVLGIVILALPMTVIVSKFNESYGDVKRKTEQDQLKRRERERETLIGECNIFVVVRNGEMWSCFGRCLLNSDFNSGGNCTLSLTLRVRELNDMLVSELKKCDNKFVLRMLVSFIFKVKSKTNTAAIIGRSPSSSNLNFSKSSSSGDLEDEGRSCWERGGCTV
eukprot:sb/3462217/